MNEHSKKQVERYLNSFKADNKDYPLYFTDKGIPVDLKVSNVINVLEYALDFESSRFKNGIYIMETFRGARRSSFDIWRHLKLFNEELQLFEVMEELYDNRDRLITFYCGTIERRVFKLVGGSGFHLSIDEFGLNFPEWSRDE